MKKIIAVVCLIIIFSSLTVLITRPKKESPKLSADNLSNIEDRGEVADSPYPLAIGYMRAQEYPGSNLTIEQTLPNGSNYDKYIVSYKSDGLKIYALLTVPQGEKPS